MSKYKLQQIAPPPPTRQAALVMTLSLFIMLLAFFMMLCASSKFEESKIETVLKSLDTTFTSRVFRDGVGPAVTPDVENLNGEGQAFESLDALFKATFTGIQPQLIPSRGIFFVELKQDQFEEKFFGGKTSIEKTLLEKLWSYGGVQMELWLNVQDDAGVTSNKDAKALQALVDKTSSWATALEKDGLDKGRLTIGLKKGKPGIVTVLFRNYKPYAPTP